MLKVKQELEQTATDVVFVSPVPVLLAKLSASQVVKVHVLHNDNREKKELPNGKIISVVAKEGWELVNVT